MASASTAPRLAVLRFPPVRELSEEEWLTSTDMPPETFVGHLDAIRRLGWEPIDAEAFVTGLRHPDTLPDRSVLLTFDGGYRSLTIHALERLRKRRWPAVAFVPTGLVGGEAALEIGDDRVREICDWSELVTLESQGISIQSLGVSHRRFHRLDPAEREAEIHESKATLEEKLGTTVPLFAFPRGESGPDADQVRQVLRLSGYGAAFAGEGRVNRVPVEDRYRIGRITMGLTTDLRRELSA